ncbi:hypothetical protein GYMLUDRAFT_100470 [Collybiopsis luxurians FD-317 M1]|uniref:Unplaced genomic scaffold GYMLUscaffold_84, whole genome shotgun sequence n=1 Tax=Collybiopsis luxurians FD-317 M1 TaxID=944289 RepID=A0A0D0BEU4_9AGAR|nr:hypothetical protein GYMLUDRAFT_100470 [Collybiopsis luxurians FD-317 M1]
MKDTPSPTPSISNKPPSSLYIHRPLPPAQCQKPLTLASTLPPLRILRCPYLHSHWTSTLFSVPSLCLSAMHSPLPVTPTDSISSLTTISSQPQVSFIYCGP